MQRHIKYINDQSQKINTAISKYQKTQGFKINQIPRFDYSRGKTFGFAHDCKLYLNGENINYYTPIHLSSHIYLEWAKVNYKPLYYKAIDLIHNSRHLTKLKETEFYKNEASKVGLQEGTRQYEEYFKQEAIALVIGNRGGQYVTELKKSSDIDWLKNLKLNLSKENGMKDLTLKELEFITLEELSKRISVEILNGGKNIFPKSFFPWKSLQTFFSKMKNNFEINVIGKLKKDKNYQSKKIVSALHENIFTGGLKEKEEAAKMIEKICNKKIDFKASLKLYVSAKSRFAVSKSIDGNYMINSILNDASNRIKEDEAKEIFKLIFFREKYLYKNRELEDAINVLYGFINNGQTGEILNNSSGPFGLVPSNPIPVKGILASENYLERLCTPDYKKVTWERMGNFTYEEFMFQMDCYKIFDPNGTHIQNIFIYPYHGKNVFKAPEGFVLEA